MKVNFRRFTNTSPEINPRVIHICAKCRELQGVEAQLYLFCGGYKNRQAPAQKYANEVWLSPKCDWNFITFWLTYYKRLTTRGLGYG